MRRVILALVSTAAGLVLLLTFKTHSTSAVNPPPAAIGSPNDSVSAPAPTPASTPGSAPGSRTVTGAAANTIYGPVQVRITVKGGKITVAQAVVYPEDTPRDQQINAFAIPELNQEAVAANGARIDMVSGATYTSQGYLSSLQSALDRAGR
jgi:uncharacterized protein with FMN-binding domain